MIKTILVPLDGSELSERALTAATPLARATGARLVLVRTAWSATLPGVDPTQAQLSAVRKAETYLSKIALEVGEVGVQVEIGIPFAPVVEGILLEIELHNPDLVIMATHSRSGFGRWVHGSVAQAVLSKTVTPVWLVRTEGPVAPLVHGATRSRILVPLDGSQFAEAALDYATTVALALGATLVLLRVVVPTEPTHHAPEIGEPFAREKLLLREQEAAQTYLAQLAQKLREDGLRVQTALRAGEPAQVILEECWAPGIGLVVMATHGRTGLAQMLLGSVAMEVLERGGLPLLLVHPQGKRPQVVEGQPRDAATTEHTEKRIPAPAA